MHALILTEGSYAWGMGHLIRCLAFSDILQSRGISTRWLIVGDESAETFIKAQSNIDAEQSNWFESSILAEYLDGCFCVVVDSYHAPLERYEQLAAAVPNCLWIDDEARLDYPCGFTLNPNPLVKQQGTRDGSEGRHQLVGYEYQVLRSEFVGIHNRHYGNAVKRIMILLGGTDLRELTPRILPVVQKVYPDAIIDVVVPKVEQRIAWRFLENKTCKLHGQLSAAEIREMMLKSDLAVTAAGQTLCETGCVGLPVLAIGVAENQRQHVQALVEAGAVSLAGWYDDSELCTRMESRLLDLQNAELRKQIGLAGRSLFDGLGAQRAIAHLLGWSKTLKLRRATTTDSKSVWEISNQPAVREYSIHKNSIPWDEHQAWFAKALANSSIFFLVVENNAGMVVGQLRYRLEGNIATVSVSLSSSVRGCGEASLLLREGDTLCFASSPVIKIIEAEISPLNAASEKSFMRAGYIKTDNTRNHGEQNYYVYHKGCNHV